MERVFTIDNGEIWRLDESKRLRDFIFEYDKDRKIYAFVLDGRLYDLNSEPSKGGELSFIYADSEVGQMIYDRTLAFVFIAAVSLLFEHSEVRMESAISNGQYCEIDGLLYLTTADVSRIKQKMDELIKNKEKIHRKIVTTKEAIAFFDSIGMSSKASLLANRSSDQSSIYSLCGKHDYFYGIMLPDASYLTHYSLRYYAPGVWLSSQEVFVEQPRLFQVYQRFEKWGKAIGVSNVAQLNEKILNGKMDELVLMSETMLEKELGELASYIVKEKPDMQFILIAGPSSAGKTTFSRRLGIHLKILGLEPFAISMDNFYRNRSDTPKKADGSYDFECLEALDLDLFEEVMMKLYHHIPVRMPIFNFKTGMQELGEEEVLLKPNQILIIEGIHGLNPRIGHCLPNHAAFKIYINALTHLNLDEHNRIPTSDYRLIRRIVRDYQTRGRDAQATISFRKSVREGEELYIYPYQEQADAIFNTSMVYELAVLKTLALPLLEKIQIDSEEYLEANRLKKLLYYFVDGKSDAIPRYSILAEFVGNSILDVS